MAADKMYPANHKTLFVLDHTPYFGISCEHHLEFDFAKSRGPGFIPLAPVSKSLWTCAVESALEYCRIVWDLFPQGKLVRFVISDDKAQVLNTWSSQQQSLNHLLNALSAIGVPPRSHNSGEYSVMHGLQGAVQAMTEATELQHEKRTTLTEAANQVLNRCRVICITGARDNKNIDSLVELFHSDLVTANKMAVASDLLMPVHECHLVMINIHPNNVETAVTAQLPREVSSLLRCEVHSVLAGIHLAGKLSHLTLGHYGLASTTVTGIPMKEEQNASSSANYDVEIFHPAHAHTALLRGGASDCSHVVTRKEGTDYETVTLKWCTPRGCSSTEMHNCTAMHRITPVDVNSRPSSCLINFLLNGRSVMLEMVRRGGGKVISHLLAAHAGEIFVHSLGTARSTLEDPPSISEGCGGRVTNYRITDFGMLMQVNRLFPLKRRSSADGAGGSTMTPLERTKARLKRHTAYWPITISATCIFNYKLYLEPMLTLVLKEELSDEEVIACKQCIYSMIGLESKHEPLQLPPAVGQRGKGPKREEQYKAMWAELETYLRMHCPTDQHGKVLHCLLECRNKLTTADDKALVKVELDQALRELDSMQGKENSHRASVIRATTDSPLSPPLQSGSLLATSSPAPHHQGGVANAGRPSSYAPLPRTVLDLFVARAEAQRGPRRPDFVGRLMAEPAPGGGTISKLYPLLKLEPLAPPPTTTTTTPSVNTTATSAVALPQQDVKGEPVEKESTVLPCSVTV